MQTAVISFAFHPVCPVILDGVSRNAAFLVAMLHFNGKLIRVSLAHPDPVYVLLCRLRGGRLLVRLCHGIATLLIRQRLSTHLLHRNRHLSPLLFRQAQLLGMKSQKLH